MTSLPLFPPADRAAAPQREWGTGAPKIKVPLWSAKPPTWHYSGEPITQFYELTKLRKSNVRWNDQLLPKPQEEDISQRMINLPFPAEHPYSSHVSRLAVFPSFATLAEEPKRGAAARASLPLSAETPAAAYDVQIVHKIKGFGDRHEVQAAPTDSLKRGLTWNEGFEQRVKALGDRPHHQQQQQQQQQFYPVPTLAVHPNMTSPRRPSELAVSEKTAECTRNIERLQWKSSHELDYTGLGPANPFRIDNYDEKTLRCHVTGVADDSLTPHFVSTFDPARPQDGRLAQLITPRGPALNSKGAAVDDSAPKHKRKPTLSEREEHRLLHGTTYVSLPDVGGSSATTQRRADEQWHTWSQTQHAEPRFERLAELQLEQLQQRQAVDDAQVGRSSLVDQAEVQASGDAGTVAYPAVLRRQQADSIQQLEATNRWKRLEAQGPQHDVAELRRKMQLATTDEKPGVFYGHEGLYNEERAGLYKTSYDPARLRLALETPVAARFDASASHSEALAYPTPLNAAIDSALHGSRTYPANVPMFSERPSPADVIVPFGRDMAVQAQLLQPSAATSRPRVQEGSVVLTRSEHGAAYNTEKFLQQYELPPGARVEPGAALMSAENLSLANVRLNALRRSAPPRLGGLSASDDVGRASAVGQAAASLGSVGGGDWMQMTRAVAQGVRSSLAFDEEGTVPRSPLPLLPSSGSLAAVERESGGGNGALPLPRYDLSYKNDAAFAWRPGCGTPRPQSQLLRMQDGFSKTDAHRRLHASFAPDGSPPSLIDNIHTGRKHEFGLNAQVLRGAEAAAAATR